MARYRRACSRSSDTGLQKREWTAPSATGRSLSCDKDGTVVWLFIAGTAPCTARPGQCNAAGIANSTMTRTACGSLDRP